MTSVSTILGENDPPPFEMVNGESGHPVLLVCEHAGRTVPKILGDLGVQTQHMQAHIAYDIGAETVARGIAKRLDAPLVLQPYSRLVIDCNRPLDAEDSIPEVSDGVAVPGNFGLDEAHRRARIDGIFNPFHDRITLLLERFERRAAFAIHSFTPVLNGEHRRWDMAVLFRKDSRTSKLLAQAVERRMDGILIGYNEPYEIHDSSDWFVPMHAERRMLPHSLIEIRNDHLLTPEDCQRWADALAEAIIEILPEL